MQVDIKKKSDALIIGNGKSRLQFDLNKLGMLFTTYGCNALYRDFASDYLIAMDPSITDEIINNKAYLNSKFYTQSTNRTTKLYDPQKLPIYYLHGDGVEARDSGNNAINLACKHEHKTIYMIGFDYITMPNSKTLNNVYAGTKCYGGTSNPHQNTIETNKWQHRLRTIIRKYPNVNFIRVNGNDYNANIHIKNFKEITVQEFKELTNEI